ncbi:MAG: NAD(P)-dependent glycerol-3-phosphate dehydrogenase [Acidobacteria bacterium]|nr:NAD(P)-dependent glycerol-3-phosphate dehydrogenase [Acidobacteriota bacterium]
MRSVTVVGAGSWGTALAVHLARVGHQVQLWARDAELVSEMAERRANAVYLPDIVFPDSLSVTADLPAALGEAQFVVVAVPSHGLRHVLRQGAAHVDRTAVVLSATKGLEDGTLLRMSQIIREEWAHVAEVAVLSGPSFARELARSLPTVVVVASTDDGAVRRVQEEFRSGAMRLYASGDVTGVELGGALKNVIAIAAGVVDGLELGHNALAALITRGVAEISRLAVAAGGERETLAGLAGMGDLVLTCTGHLSRNRHVGIELARGRSVGDIVDGMKMVAEGVRTTRAALALGRRLGVELPIAAQVDALLGGRVAPAAAVVDLMGRRQRAESD